MKQNLMDYSFQRKRHRFGVHKEGQEHQIVGWIIGQWQNNGNREKRGMDKRRNLILGAWLDGEGCQKVNSGKTCFRVHQKWWTEMMLQLKFTTCSAVNYNISWVIKKIWPLILVWWGFFSRSSSCEPLDWKL